MLCDFQNVAEETCIITKFLSTNYLNFACLFLKGKKFIAPTSQKKKEILLDEPITDKDWKFYFTNASVCIKDTKIIYFQNCFQFQMVLHCYKLLPS